MTAARVLAACLTVEVAVLASPQDRTVFRSGVDTVTIYATVRDPDGRLATTLTREDFELIDNGRPVEVSAFSSDIQPITVAVLLDMSGSMASRLMRVRESTLHFIDALLPQDRAQIGTFGAEVALSPLLTGDKATLKRVVLEELWPGGGTPLWAAVGVAMRALEREPGRRVILTLTDGRDTGEIVGRPTAIGDAREKIAWRGAASFDRVRRWAVEAGFMVYAIGVRGGGLDDDMVDFTEETGGGSFQLRLDEDLPATFTAVADELRRQYVLGFVPANRDGKVHTLELRVRKPGHTVRARKRYLAEVVR